MAEIFAAYTSHGTTLAVDKRHGRFLHACAEEFDTFVSKIFLVSGEKLGSRCLLLRIDLESGRLVLSRDSVSGCGPLVLATPSLQGTTLRSLVTNRFLSAVPGGTIETNRSTAAGWEHFQIVAEPVPNTETSLQLINLQAIVENTLAASRPWAGAMETLLMGPPSELAAAVAEAIWPLLTLDEVDRVALRLRLDRDVVRRFAALFPGDYWADTALPALQHWLTIRDAPIRGSLSPPPPQRITTELDHLAQAGVDGCLKSIPHACNAALRLKVIPRQGTAIVATARSEGVYLLEWIAYHRLIGIEAIYLYTNNNDEGSDALLAALHAAGVIHWTQNELNIGVSAQNKAYGHALNVLLPVLNHRWALFIDLDEFLVLDPARYSSVAEFARWHEMRQTDAVGINWVMVGSSGQARWHAEPLTRRNTHLRDDSHAHIKVMMSPRLFVQAHPHFPFIDPRRSYVFRLANGELHEHRRQPSGAYHAKAFADRSTTDEACIYHYYYKSLEEFVWKSSRNRGDSPMSPSAHFQGLDRAAVARFLEQHNSTVFDENDRIRRCAPGLDDEIERLRALPAIRDAEQQVVTHFTARLFEVKEQLLAGERLDGLGADGEALRTLLLRV